jgi:hypothetical protein
MTDRDLLTALDAHRPGESLTDDPALGDVARQLETDTDARRLRDRVEAADRRIAAAMQVVEPPAGLADRLLSRLAQSHSSEPHVSEHAITPAAPPAKLRRPKLRRRAFLAGGVAAAAAAVIIAIQFWPKPAEPWTAEQVLDAAIGLYTRDTRTAGRPLAELPSDLPPSDGLVKLPASTQWRRLSDALEFGDAVAYDIELFAGGPRGTLYAVSPSAPVTGLPDAPPRAPATPTTQGVCAAAWQHRNIVYVLVVEGGPHEYRQFLRNQGSVIVTRQSHPRQEAVAVAQPG